MIEDELARLQHEVQATGRVAVWVEIGRRTAQALADKWNATTRRPKPPLIASTPENLERYGIAERWVRDTPFFTADEILAYSSLYQMAVVPSDDPDALAVASISVPRTAPKGKHPPRITVRRHASAIMETLR